MTGHQLDISTVDTEPRCVCGGEWVDGDCFMRGTFFGDRWELGQATRQFCRTLAVALRLDRLVDWVARFLHPDVAIDKGEDEDGARG